MNAEYFRQLLHQHPFEPFMVHLSRGEVHPVRHPECAALTNTRLVIVDPEGSHHCMFAFAHRQRRDVSTDGILTLR